jgi:hypothetical protein
MVTAKEVLHGMYFMVDRYNLHTRQRTHSRSPNRNQITAFWNLFEVDNSSIIAYNIAIHYAHRQGSDKARGCIIET